MLRFMALIFVFLCLNPIVALASNSIETILETRPEIAPERQPIVRSKEVVNQVLKEKPFVNIESERIWNFERDDNPETNDLDIDLAWLAEILKFIALLIEASLWLLPLVIVYFLYKYREYWLNLVQGKGFKRSSASVPETVFGLDISQENLPDDIQAVALELWCASRHRDAISLLYRGALASVFSRYTFSLPPGATENDCIRHLKSYQHELVSAEESTLAEFNNRLSHFIQLTGLWVQIAYAHRVPDENKFMSLCKNWNSIYSDKKVGVSS